MAVEPWEAAGAMAEAVDDDGSYLTCGAAHDYYDYASHRAATQQMIVA